MLMMSADEFHQRSGDGPTGRYRTQPWVRRVEVGPPRTFMPRRKQAARFAPRAAYKFDRGRNDALANTRQLERGSGPVHRRDQLRTRQLAGHRKAGNKKRPAPTVGKGPDAAFWGCIARRVKLREQRACIASLVQVGQNAPAKLRKTTPLAELPTLARRDRFGALRLSTFWPELSSGHVRSRPSCEARQIG